VSLLRILKLRNLRMNKRLFLRIVDALGQWSPYFTYRADCASRIGLSPLQKCIAAMCMLAYDTPVDALKFIFRSMGMSMTQVTTLLMVCTYNELPSRRLSHFPK
jgi:hypothetical protein